MSIDTTALGLAPIEGAKRGDDDLILWSVTTITGALDKPGLMYWASEQAAIAAVNQQATWRGMLEDCDNGCRHDSADDCPAVKWLRDARWRRPRNQLSDTDRGTVVHKLAEEYALTGERPDRDRIAELIRASGPGVDLSYEGPLVLAMLDRFDEWLQRFTPEYQATEVIVYSPTYGYAGQTDAFLTIDGVRSIVDYKSTRKPRDGKGKPKTPYPEVGLQLAAYRNAEFAAVWRPRRDEIQRRRYYFLSPEERAMAVPVPEVDGGLCIHITSEACEAYPVRCDQRIHDAFLYVLEAARFQYETAKTVLGQPLRPAREN